MVLASIFFLLPITGIVAAEEDIVISAKGYDLTEFDQKLIKSTMKAKNTGLPVKEVMIVVEPYELKSGNGSVTRGSTANVIITGEAADDFFEAKDFLIEGRPISSIRRALGSAIQKRNEKQAAGNKAGDKAVNPSGSGTQGKNDKDLKSDQKRGQDQKEADSAAPKAEKPKAKFKIIKKQ